MGRLDNKEESMVNKSNGASTMDIAEMGRMGKVVARVIGWRMRMARMRERNEEVRK